MNTPTDKPEALSDDLNENFDRFIVESLEQGCVWGLQSPEGWALCESEKYENTDVMPLWSQEIFAQVHAQGDWKDYVPIAIELTEFLEEWLPGMHEDVLLIGVNWDENLEGEEYEPLDLLEEFDTEIDD